MGTETTLSKTMAASTEKEQYDNACKRLSDFYDGTLRKGCVRDV